MEDIKYEEKREFIHTDRFNYLYYTLTNTKPFEFLKIKNICSIYE